MRLPRFPLKLSIRISGADDNCIETMLDKLLILGANIMSIISEFAEKQKEHNDRIDAAVTGLQGDIQSLNDIILELQTSAGTITPEDQALLDDIQARSETIATKLEALDALTPPATPPEEV